MKGLGTWLASVVGPLARRVIGSLGVGIASYAGMKTAIDSALANVGSLLSGLTGSAAQILAMAGVNTAISIIAGGISMRVAYMAISKFEIKAT